MTLLRLYGWRRSIGMRPMSALRSAIASRMRDWQRARDRARLLRLQLPFTDSRG
ncbi:MAG: hypothetical protein AB9M53_00535 [Leptothrix sp. (in: b-proteobacteria)]